MAGLNDRNTTDDLDNAVATLNGATDNTRIGNVDDRLKVDANISGISSLPSWNPSYFVYENMTFTRGANLSTSFQNIYSYTGAGYFSMFLVTFEQDDNEFIRLIIDGNDILFGATGLSSNDFSDINIFDAKDIDVMSNYIDMHDETITFRPRYPIKINTSLVIQARSTSSNKFRAGYLSIQKGL